MAKSRDRSAQRRPLKTVLGVLAAAVVTLLLIEGAARCWLVFLASEEQFNIYASPGQFARRRANPGHNPHVMFVPHRYLGFVTAPRFKRGPNYHNELGYRGDSFPREKPEGEFRVICAGGSTTYTSGVREPASSYPALLETALHERGYPHVRVINAGAMEYKSWETLINLELRLLDLDPDVLIVYHGVNDVNARLVWPPEAYAGDNSGYSGHSPGLHRRLPWWQRSTAARVLLVRFGFIQPPMAIYDTYATFAPTAHWVEFTRQNNSGTYPEGVFEEVPAMRMLETNEPVYFRRNIESLVAVAKAHGVTPVLATFALCTHPPSSWNSDEYRFAIGQHNAVLRETGQEMGIPVFDFAGAFPDDETLFADAIHVNEEGALLKARLFADYLIEQGLIEQEGNANERAPEEPAA